MQIEYKPLLNAYLITTRAKKDLLGKPQRKLIAIKQNRTEALQEAFKRLFNK